MCQGMFAEFGELPSFVYDGFSSISGMRRQWRIESRPFETVYHIYIYSYIYIYIYLHIYIYPEVYKYKHLYIYNVHNYIYIYM